MPRQRKPQNGGQRLGTGRVANTTTSTPKLQTVYRVPAGRDYGSCEKLAYEVLWTSPIQVRIEGENVYRISLDADALKRVIENYDNLELSNVTLQTVNGEVTFTGSMTAEWEFTGTTVTATTGNITTVNATDINTTNIVAEDVSTQTLEVSLDTTLGWNLEVNWTSTFHWDVTMDEDLTVTGTATINNISATTGAISSLESVNLGATNWNITDLSASNAAVWVLNVTWQSEFIWDMSTNNISSSGTAALTNATVSTSLLSEGTTTLNTLTVNGAATLVSNASIGGNLSVTGNETVTGNMTVTWDGIFSDDVSVAHDLTVSWDTTLTDDLTVNGTTHLKDLETTNSVDIAGTLRVEWAINGENWLVVDGQIESDTVRTSEIVTDEIRITQWLYLSQWAEAPDFILQSEKGEPNGVAPLNANGIVPEEHLPPIYTSAIVKVGVWTFDNSNTSTVIDDDITSDSFVAISNYEGIVWDCDENILPGSNWTPGKITVVSNEVETWSYKYIVVNPLNSCNS